MKLQYQFYLGRMFLIKLTASMAFNVWPLHYHFLKSVILPKIRWRASSVFPAASWICCYSGIFFWSSCPASPLLLIPAQQSLDGSEVLWDSMVPPNSPSLSEKGVPATVLGWRGLALQVIQPEVGGRDTWRVVLSNKVCERCQEWTISIKCGGSP